MNWFDGLLLVLVLAIVLFEARQEVGRSMLDAMAALAAVHFSTVSAAILTPLWGWKADISGSSPTLQGLLFVVFLAAALLVARAMHRQLRWSMENFDLVFGVAFGLVVGVCVGHVVTDVAAHQALVATGRIPDYLQNSCVADELRSFHTYHYVMDVLRNSTSGGN